MWESSYKNNDIGNLSLSILYTATFLNTSEAIFPIKCRDMPIGKRKNGLHKE